jgi:hypothetical protein
MSEAHGVLPVTGLYRVYTSEHMDTTVNSHQAGKSNGLRWLYSFTGAAVRDGALTRRRRAACPDTLQELVPK